MKEAPPPPRKRLLEFDVDGSGEHITIPDQRATAAQDLRREQRGIASVVHQVFEGTGLPGDKKRLRTMLALRGEIIESWGQAQAAFLHVGRTLNRLEATLTDEERNKLRESGTRLFPFSKSVASQLRQVALAVDDGRLQLATLPHSYSVAYQLSRLNPDELSLASEKGLLRPDVTRGAIIRFRRDLYDCHQAGNDVLSKSQLQDEIAQLEVARRETLVRLVAMRKRIREIKLLLEA